MNLENFSDCLLDIYKASAVPMHWQAVLERFTEKFDNGKAAITKRSNIVGHIDVKNISSSKVHNIDQLYLEKYINKYVKEDVWTPHEWKYKVGELCVFSDNLPVPELKKTIYWKEWLGPQGITDGIAMQLYNCEAFRIVLNVIYHHESKNINELHQDLRTLSPHLCQSVELWMASLDQDDSCYANVDSDYLKERYNLTPREAEAVILSVRLGTYKEIADNMCVAETTVKGYFDIIKSKMGVRYKHEVMLIATGFIGSSRK